MLSWISRITPSQTEKSIRIGLVVAVGTLGGIIGPNLYGFTAIRDTDSSGVQRFLPVFSFFLFLSLCFW